MLYESVTSLQTGSIGTFVQGFMGSVLRGLGLWVQWFMDSRFMVWFDCILILVGWFGRFADRLF